MCHRIQITITFSKHELNQMTNNLFYNICVLGVETGSLYTALAVLELIMRPTGLELKDLPASLSQMLGRKASATNVQLVLFIFFKVFSWLEFLRQALTV